VLKTATGERRANSNGGQDQEHVNKPAPHQRDSKLVYFVTEDWYFCSHRLPLAVAAREAGYKVYVITRVASHADEITSAGLELIPFELSRRSKNPATELSAIYQLTRVYRRLKPDIVHHVALKPVIYGSIAAWIAGIRHVVNALAGLGYIFLSNSTTARTLRPLITTLMRVLLNNERTKVILQNPDDADVVCGPMRVARDRVVQIRGSGVDPDVYRQVPESQGTPIVMLASRLLWDKGIGEFVEAASILLAEGCAARFVLVGEGDDANPASIDSATLDAWRREGHVELWGRREDMPDVLPQAHIVCLPSYREGLPKVLIEAASCARPVVATDAPGCREIVRHGKNGLLVPVRDAKALADAIRTLLDDPALRSRMGNNGRDMVKQEFTVDHVIAATLDVYKSMLEGVER
jgi:glycosyltransferase involved in cell wall biosynthesis